MYKKKFIMCSLSCIMCHMSPVTCHLATTLCSFSCYTSLRHFGDAAVGGAVIDRVKSSYQVKFYKEPLLL